MTYATGMRDDLVSYDRDRLFPKVSPSLVFGAVALAFSVSVGAWILQDRPMQSPPADETGAVERPAAPTVAASVVSPSPIRPAVATSYGALLDPELTGSTAMLLAQSAPLGAAFEGPAPSPASPPAPVMPDAQPGSIIPLVPPTLPNLVAEVPLPAPRPPELRLQASQGPVRTFGRPAAQPRTSVVRAAPQDNRSFFEKLFGVAQPTGPVLAYAAPEDGAFDFGRRAASSPMLPYDRYTAVYDISAHTVYMPDGSTLEAHSGLGDRLDDPRSVTERNRGATPPHVYDLEPRAQLFHGVRALRLNPVGGGGVFGRTGLLAHTFMLGPKGDSNGCVSFRNYNAFLQAYANGEVKRLAVVTRRI